MQLSPFFQYSKSYFRYLWVLAIASYLSISAARALQSTYESQGEIAQLTAELASLQQEKARYEALNIYYQTDAYKEKELRRALLLVKPNERVYSLPESSLSVAEEKTVIVTSDTKKRPSAVSASGRLESWMRFVRGTAGVR